MDQPHLRQEDIKALEQTRQRLYQLTNNIGSLKNDVLHSNPLPDWAALQTSGSILAKNIQGLSEHLAAHADLMERTVIYPSTNYPGRTQEGMLVQLVRKKLEPSIEEWVEEGRSIQKGTGDSEDELFNWAREWIGQRVAEYATTEAGDNYTAEEREMGIENVNTGLRRKLDDDEEDSSEEEDEDEEMSGTGAMDVTVVRKPSMGQVEFGLGELNPQNKRKDGKVRSFEDILEFATRGEILPKQEMRR